jgi:hypothetical protein
VAADPHCLAGLPRRAVLDLSHDLKGATAMTDPNDTTDTAADEELSIEALDAVAGGTDSFLLDVSGNDAIFGTN